MPFICSLDILALSYSLISARMLFFNHTRLQITSQKKSKEELSQANLGDMTDALLTITSILWGWMNKIL